MSRGFLSVSCSLDATYSVVSATSCGQRGIANPHGDLELGIREEQVEAHVQRLRGSDGSPWTGVSVEFSSAQSAADADRVNKPTRLLSCSVLARHRELAPLLGCHALDLCGVEIRPVSLQVGILQPCACCSGGHRAHGGLGGVESCEQADLHFWTRGEVVMVSRVTWISRSET